MEDIKVGEYVRTKEGHIGIYEGLPTGNEYVSYNNHGGNLRCFKNFINKHSPNIIDLIEVRRLCEWRKNYYIRKWRECCYKTKNKNC